MTVKELATNIALFGGAVSVLAACALAVDARYMNAAKREGIDARIEIYTALIKRVNGTVSLYTAREEAELELSQGDRARRQRLENEIANFRQQITRLQTQLAALD